MTGVAHASSIDEALPDYTVLEEIGSGSFGLVFRARHDRLGRSVAIKRLPPVLARDPEVRHRFVTEAQVLSTMDHPHIVPVFDFVDRAGECLLVMELLMGGSLRERQRDQPLTLAELVAVTIATCSGLTAAHRVGVLHRDIKPANLLFAGSGAVKIVDFGIAKMIGGTESIATVTGTVLGSLSFMAPEQVLGEVASAATDVYALATVLYQALTGRLPFAAGHDQLRLLAARVHESPQPIGPEDQVPPMLAAAIMRGLARSREERYASTEAFGVDLATAAYEALGPGWLRDLPTRVYADGALLEALGPGLSDDRHRATATQEQRAVSGTGTMTPTGSDDVGDARPSGPGPVGAAGTGSGGGAEVAPEPSFVAVRELFDQVPSSSIVTRPGAVAPAGFDYHLEIIGSNGALGRVAVAAPLLVGRDGSGLVVGDTEVSRRHCLLTPTPFGLEVIDLGSSNGTFVASTPVVGQVYAHPGDEIRVGSTRLAVVSVTPSVPRAQYDHWLLASLLQGALDMTGAEAGWLVDYHDGVVGVLSVAGVVAPSWVGEEFDDPALSSFVAGVSEPIVSPGTPGGPLDATAWPLGGVDVRTRLSVPCIFDHRVVALLEVGSASDRSWHAHVPFVSALSRPLGVVVQASRRGERGH